MRVRDIAARAASDLGLPPSLAHSAWVNNRFQEWATEKRLKPFRKLFELTLPALIKAGTITITKGSKEVTGDATAMAAWSNALVGRFIQLKTNWYEIVGVTPTPSLLLGSAYVSDDITAGAYSVVERRTKLDPSVRWPGAFVNILNGITLDKCSMDVLDSHAPLRGNLAGGPVVVAELGYNEEDILELEFYPPDTKDTLIRYTGYVQPPVLGEDDEVPRYLDPYILIEAVKIDVMRKKATEAADNGNSEIASFWRNDYRAQETRWDRKKGASQKSAEAIDDSTFILSMLKHSGLGVRDITTGREHKLSQWEPLT
jgi:hypothetical protein